MSEQEKTVQSENGLAGVLDKLLEYQKQNGEKNTLIMLALLNLLGIVNGIGKGKNEGDSSPGNINFNPAMLLNLLGAGQGNKGQGFDLSSLMGLLGNFLGGMPGGGTMPQPSQKNSGPVSPPVGKAAGKMKVEKNVYKPENKTAPKGNKDNIEKSQVSKQTNPGTKNVPEKKPEVIKWDFGDEKKD